MTPDTGRLRELAKAVIDAPTLSAMTARSADFQAVATPQAVLSLCDAADRAVRLEEALRTLHDRLMACAAPISARDAYDSFYQQIALEALK